MRYYVDGYNLMFRFVKAGDELTKKRRQIVEELSEKVAALNLNVIVVFDAACHPGEATRSHHKQLEIQFTPEGQIADDYILHTLKREADPLKVTIVTSDKRLAKSARLRLAKTETVESFMARLNKQYKKKQERLAKEEGILLSKRKTRLPKEGKGYQTEITLTPSEQQYLEHFESQISKQPQKKYRSEMERWLDIFEERYRNI